MFFPFLPVAVFAVGILIHPTGLWAQNSYLDYRLVEVHQFEGHVHPVGSLTFSPDAQFLAAGSTHGAIRIWEIKRQRQVAVRQRAGHINSLAFSPDSKSLYLGGPAVVLERWTPASGEVQEIIKEDRRFHGMGFVSLSPGANRVLTGPGSFKNPQSKELLPVTLWELDTGKPLKEWKMPVEIVKHVALTPDGRRAFVAGGYYSNTKSPIEFHASGWNTQSDRQILRFEAKDRVGFHQAALSPDGEFAYAVGPRTAETRTWSMRSGKLIHEHEFYFRNGRINALASFPESHLLAAIRSYGLETNLSVLDFAEGKELAVLPQGEFPFNSIVAVSPDARFVAAATTDHQVRLYRVEPVRRDVKELPVVALKNAADSRAALPRKSIAFEPGSVFEIPSVAKCIAVSPDGKSLATGHQDGSVFLWDANTGKRIRKIADHTAEVRSIVFSPDGNYVASSGSAVLLSDLTGKRRKAKVLYSWDRGLRVGQMAFVSDGKSLIIGGYDSAINSLEIPSGKLTRKVNAFTSVMALSSDGKTLAAITRERLRIYDVETGKERGAILHPGQVRKLLFTDKDKTLLTSSDDGFIRLWDLASLEETSRLELGTTEIGDTHLIKNDLILMLSRRNTITLWEQRSGRQLALLNEDSSHRLMDLAISPDGEWFVGCFDDPSIRRWNLSR